MDGESVPSGPREDGPLTVALAGGEVARGEGNSSAAAHAGLARLLLAGRRVQEPACGREQRFSCFTSQPGQLNRLQLNWPGQPSM